jgi:adenosylcobinamide-GDP ribazoletransferase
VRVPWSAPLIAIEFLTPLRLRRVERWDDRTFGASLGWFPAVGLLLGVVLLLLDRGLERILPAGPADALLIVALALLTGGLHLDGVADTADGMAVQGDRATRLGVMSAGNIGPAGVMALLLVLLVQWSALVSLEAPLRSAGIVLAPALARWSVTPVAALFPSARPRGIGHALQQGIWPSAVPVAIVIAFGASVALFGLPGLVLPLIAAAAALIMASAVARMLAGVTGDTFGACIEISQAAVLLSFVVAGERGWLDPTFLK